MKFPVIAVAMVAAIATALVPMLEAEAVLTGDADRGKDVYAACLYCHAIDANHVGPMHRGLVGRRAGTVPGFSYSAAMKRAGENGLVWTPEMLDRYLTDPRKVVPGTRMIFAGIADPQSRADLIAYLEKATAPNAAAQ